MEPDITIVSEFYHAGERYALGFKPTGDERKDAQKLRALIFSCHVAWRALEDGTYPTPVAPQGAS